MKRKYEAAAINPQVRDALGSVGAVLKKRGTTMAEVESVFKEAGFPISKSTLYSYVQAAEAGSTPLSASKASGAKKKLGELERRILAGYFLHREDEGLKSGLPLYKSAALDMFDIKVSSPTSCRYLEESHLSRKMLGPRERAQTLTEDERVVDYFDCVQHLHEVQLFAQPPANIWNIDVVTNKQRNEDMTTYGRHGGQQRKIKKETIAHTDSLITMVNMLGEQIGPFISTSNPDLNPNGPNRKKLLKALGKYKLLEDDIDYRQGAGNYVKEDRAMYKKFLEVHRPWEGHWVLTDNATLYIENDKCIFESRGFEGAPKLTASVHGAMSLLDGVIHPVAKAQWRSMWYDKQPQWERTLQLAYCIITVDKNLVARKWREHFFLDMQLTLLGVEKFLHPKDFAGHGRQEHWDTCLKEYKAWVAVNGEVSTLLPSNELKSYLDGDYWGK